MYIFRIFLNCFWFLGSVVLSFHICASALVEEGWRYHGSFRTILRSEHTETVHDFSPLHMAMAQTLESQTHTDQYCCLIRLTPVFEQDRELVVGPSVKISPIDETYPLSPLLTSYEVGFTSGLCDHTIGDVLWKYRRPLSLHRWGGEKSEMFSLWPPFHKERKEFFSNTLAVRLVQRNYVDPQLLEERVHFRYPDSPDRTIFERGNYRLLWDIHSCTKLQIEERKRMVGEVFDEMRHRAAGNDWETVLPAVRRDELKRQSRAFHDNAGANSYTCAEQTALDYLCDDRVGVSLQEAMGARESHFAGCIVHVHCSHTPCSTCATSLSREREEGGILWEIAARHPVFILCSARNLYERKPPMVPYNQVTCCQSHDATPFLEQLDAPSSFVFSPSASPMPYPMVLLREGATRETLEFDRGRVARIAESF